MRRNVFNTDLFDAIEDLCAEADFEEVCRTAGFQPQSVDCGSLRDYVFLVGPKKGPDHHGPQVPPDISGAREKDKE